MTLRTILTVAAGAASAFIAMTPAAAADEATRSVAVRYTDLDLASDAGQAALGSRLNRAAASICGDHARDLGVMRAQATCRTDAVADAQARMVDVTTALKPSTTVVVAAR